MKLYTKDDATGRYSEATPDEVLDVMKANAVARLEEAAKQDALAGSMTPEDAADARADLASARRDLLRWIA